MVEFNWLAWVIADMDMKKENRDLGIEIDMPDNENDAKHIYETLMEDIDESMFDDLPF